MSNNIDIISNISMVESRLPAGFRFHPRDEELVCDYLFNKILNLISSSSSSSDINHYSSLFIHVDLNKSEPWEIPESARVGGKEWYFYSQRDRKYATGLRTNRATASGYWKATGKDRPVLRKGGGSTSLVGMRKTLVFYQGRAPKGRKTDWVLHEFRLEGSLASKLSSLKEDWVLCRVFYKSREALPTNMNMNMNMNMNNNHMGTCPNMISQSLPALMDAANNNYISFDDQSKPTPNALVITSSHDHQQQQVSCFSNNIINNLPQNDGAVLEDPYFSYGESENEVIKALLYQLTNPNLNSGSPPSLSMAEGTSEANIWTHFS